MSKNAAKEEKKHTKQGRENREKLLYLPSRASSVQFSSVRFGFGARDKVEHGETATIKGAIGGMGYGGREVGATQAAGTLLAPAVQK